MGFGSYDESEQEQNTETEEREGETKTNEIKTLTGEEPDAKGESTTKDQSTEELLKHL